LKVDESTIEGPLRIRVRSFVETAEMKSELAAQNVSAQNGEGVTGSRPAAENWDNNLRSYCPTSSEAGVQVTPSASKELADPYPVKYTAATKRGQATVLVPNTSHAFSRVMAAAFASQGVNAVPLELGRERAIELGKRYVHNDICFPAQIVIGEILAALESGKYDTTNVAVGMGKYVGDCRLTHYSALLRKALDDAGWAHVPIITNDTVDSHNMHPGFKMNTLCAMRIAWALPMIDALEELLRKIRPYELEPGSTQAAFDHALDLVIDGMAHGLRGMNKGFEAAIDVMRGVPYDRAQRRPRVLIVGEYLLNFHPGANRDIEDYLEREGFEIVEARMTDVIRKTYFYKHAQAREFKVDRPLAWRAENTVSDNFFELAHDNCDRIARAHALYEPPTRMPELVRESDAIVHHTFDAGEGVLIPAEIIHNARHGVGSFVILQPFGCLPNHIVGRGIAAQLKREFPQARILALDYDPDMSFANIENRLQMLVMGAREEQFNTEEVAEKGRARQACEFIANAAEAAAAAAHGAAGAAAGAATAAAHEVAGAAVSAATEACGAAATAAHGAAEAAGAVATAAVNAASTKKKAEQQ
jgi:predicted nucleotide-binding protein (sugar kinase/HSP70/actin superfamily)